MSDTPISLICCLHKIITKVLATRLKNVIGTVVDDMQTGFVKNRNILDGPMIINEICSWAKHSKQGTFFFKVDLNKAFDTLNWHYLDSVM